MDATNTIRLTTSDSNSYSNQILAAIQEIKDENPSVSPEDVAIIILGDYKTLCSIADETSLLLYSKYSWNSAKGYETKKKEANKVYISNVNNVKGLEFPFVICIVPQLITTNVLTRNSIYMALTRSFLTSYFIVDDRNESFYEIYSSAIKRITEEGKMELQEPTPKERQEMATNIQITLSAEKKTFAQIMDDLFNAEYPRLDSDSRKFVEDTIRRIANKLTEDQIKQRARSFIDEVMGAGLS